MEPAFLRHVPHPPLTCFGVIVSLLRPTTAPATGCTCFQRCTFAACAVPSHEFVPSHSDCTCMIYCSVSMTLCMRVRRGVVTPSLCLPLHGLRTHQVSSDCHNMQNPRTTFIVGACLAVLAGYLTFLSLRRHHAASAKTRKIQFSSSRADRLAGKHKAAGELSLFKLVLVSRQSSGKVLLWCCCTVNGKLAS